MPWQAFLRWLSSIVSGKPGMPTYRVPELPDEGQPNTVYLVGEGSHLWIAALRCPCGCGAFLQMSLMPEGRPRWTATQHWDGTTTLHPSVWRQTGCRSHFFLRRGRIHWCPPTVR